ncbi:MAG: bifunctional UDP-3-O-[3-hydroxymyristoyl] N-acetylglucosamine deacetylase/3-hydroxyacyl-ACP dehydratase [Bacteroidota bacterium]
MNHTQHTITSRVTVLGHGLHTGQPVKMTFAPAPPNHGFVFKRVDLPGDPEVHARVEHVVDTSRGTTIAEKGVKVHTVEHTLAALAGLQIDNCLIEIDGPEPPIMDGSAKFFSDALLSVGLQEQGVQRNAFVITEPICYEEVERNVKLTIGPSNNFQALVNIDFNSSVLKPQQAELKGLESFPNEIADSRTFVFLHEIESLYNAGLIQGGDLESAVVIVDRHIQPEELERLGKIFNKPNIQVREGVLNERGFRHTNEPARHKLLDLVGDLALVGVPIVGHVEAIRPGHKANVELAKMVKSQLQKQRITRKFQTVEKDGIIFDINAIQRILPHRYPFLLVDKITEFSPNRIVGVKNVTINEPFFQGHFPGNPIMPGVLQLEAMAQVGGILLLNTIENPESVWVFIAAIDNARFKKPVVPGDSLVFELELITMKRSICKMKGVAKVDGQVVSFADMVASIVPKEKS